MRKTLKDFATADNKITLQNVLDVIESLGGMEESDGCGFGDDCFGPTFLLDDPYLDYDLLICFDGTVIEEVTDGEDSKSVKEKYSGLSREDIITLAEITEYGPLIDYQGEFYSPEIDPYITDINDNLLEFIKVEEHILIIGPLRDSLVPYLSASEWRKKIEEENSAEIN